MHIKILQWNVWNEEGVGNIIRFVKKVNPDIACFQELVVGGKWNKYEDVPKKIANELHFYYAFFPAQKQPNEKGEQFPFGNGIFSRFPIKAVFSRHVQKEMPYTGNYSTLGRIYGEVRVAVPGKRALVVGTTHTSYTKRFVTTPAKRKEADALLSILRRKKRNFIFTGDLNASPRSYTIENIQRYLKHCGPDFRENTWTTKPFDYRGFRETKLRWRLDYVFATKDVKVLSSRIPKTKYSDHLPILLEIDV
ncbi:MAG: endonuclease/exonuclease/phosphatase family protein [Minisyncoccia bacterium]|jgi:endonuclease/exonuclease/phosphatase family metal-dependent hydrolase